MSDDGDDHVLEQVVGGKSVRSLGKELKLSSHQITKALDRVLGPLDNDMKRRAVLVDLHRLEVLIGVFLEKAKAGCVQSALLVTKALERKSQLLGLDCPVQVDFRVEAKPAPKQFEQIRRAVYRIARGRPPDDGGGGNGPQLDAGNGAGDGPQPSAGNGDGSGPGPEQPQ
jgi:hypothetical protein